MKKWLDKYQSKGEVVNAKNPIKLKEVVIRAKKPVYQYTPQNFVAPSFNNLSQTTYGVTPYGGTSKKLEVIKNNNKKRPKIKLQNQIFASNTRDKVLADRRNYYFPYETEQTRQIRDLADEKVFQSSGDLISAIHPIGLVINTLYQGADESLPFEGVRYLPNKIPFRRTRGYNNLMPILKPVSRFIDPIQMIDKLRTADSLYNSADSIDLYNQFKNGGLVSKNSLNRKVTCSNCGWSWKLSDGGMDPMTCHKCGGDIKMQQGGPIVTPRGQWDYPGQTTIIPSNEITMTGVNYPVLGVDNTGHQIMMQPGGNYTFPGQYVTEYPMREWLNKYEKGGSKKYIVKPGDNLSTIAQNYNIPLNKLVQINNIKNPDLILTGQKLIIPKNSRNNDAEMAAIADKRLKYFESQQSSNNKQKQVAVNNPYFVTATNANRRSFPTSGNLQYRIPINIQQRPIVENTKINFPKHIQQIPIDPFTHQPLTREQIQMQKFVTPFNKPQPTISQGTWKGNRKTKDNSFDPYLRIIEQDPESEANIGKRKRKELVTKKLPAALGAATGIVAAPTLMASAAPYINAPLTVGATTVPWLTPGTMIGAGFGLHGANQLGNQVSSGYYSSNAPISEKIFTGVTTGLDMLGMPGVVEGLAAHLVNPLYRGALKTGQYISEGKLPQSLNNVKTFAIQSGKDIKNTYREVKQLEDLKKNNIAQLKNDYKKGIYFGKQNPEQITAEDLPTELKFLHDKTVKYFAEKLPNPKKALNFLNDKLFNRIYNQHGGKKVFWDKVYGFEEGNKFTEAELKNLYKEMSSSLPNQRDAAALVNKEFSTLKNNKIYNPSLDNQLLQSFIKNRGRILRPEKVTPTEISETETEALKAIRNLGKYKNLLSTKKNSKILLTMQQPVAELYENALKVNDDMLKSVLPKISREDIVTAFNNLNNQTSEAKSASHLFPNIDANVSQQMTQLDPYFQKASFDLQNRNKPSLFYNLTRNYQNSFVPTYNLDMLGQVDNATPLIGTIKHEYDLAPNPNFVKGSNEHPYIKIDRYIGDGDGAVSIGSTIRKAIGTVNNADKGTKFRAAESLSSDSYPMTLDMGLKFTQSKQVEPMFAGNIITFNEMGYASKNPNLVLKEINSKIDDLEKFSGKKFPRSKYVKGSYYAPEFYFQKLKHGGYVYSTGGEMIKRADGSYSRPGLWDNIRNNRGSGKAPTKQMLEQERKIRNQYQGGGEQDIYWRTGEPMVNDPSMDAISKVLLQRNLDKNFMQRAAGFGYQGGIPTKYIPEQDPNSDAVSTLLMSFGDNQVFPTIIQTGPEQLSYQPDQKQEYITAPSWDIADYFARKGYKRAANDMYDMEYKNGGYVVRRSHDRKGKTHVVTGPDGTKKYFGDPNMGERGKSKYGKEAFYARHKSNLAKNPYFRAYARATWEEGGETYAIGGQSTLNPIVKKDNRNWLDYLKN